MTAEIKTIIPNYYKECRSCRAVLEFIEEQSQAARERVETDPNITGATVRTECVSVDFDQAEIQPVVETSFKTKEYANRTTPGRTMVCPGLMARRKSS